MKIGMIGLPQTGKKTLFELLTAHKPTEAEMTSLRPIKGVAEIMDGRFDKLCSIYNPQKRVRARIDIELIPKLEKDSIAKGDVFKDINDLDAICHVVRSFRDDSVYHVDGSIDERRDIDFVNAELLLHDLIFIEKRVERLDKTIKQTKEEAAIKERDILAKLKGHLDKGLPLRTLALTAGEEKLIASYPLLSRKEMFIVLNVSEDALKDNAMRLKLAAELSSFRIDAMQVSAKVEEEIMALESGSERREFMQSLGITESAIDLMTQLCLRTLNLISFFTVGPDEVRQWNVRRGSSAPEASGVIHTDLQRGFIRAEVMKYGDLMALGSEEKVKEAGKYLIKGKDYIVDDGDMLNIRFNV
ncbi:MAG: redox-regulated ATPase YchF [Candidatus Omnitrophota bacterium]